jgi:hypothetical protein
MWPVTIRSLAIRIHALCVVGHDARVCKLCVSSTSRTVALALRADPKLFKSPAAVDAQNPRGEVLSIYGKEGTNRPAFEE